MSPAHVEAGKSIKNAVANKAILPRPQKATALDPSRLFVVGIVVGITVGPARHVFYPPSLWRTGGLARGAPHSKRLER